MVAFVANPRVTLNIIPRDQYAGLDDQRALIVAQRTSSAALAAGFHQDLPRTEAEINTALGAASHAALVARAFRRANPYTNLDIKLLADAGGATAGTAVIVAAGTATEAKTVEVIVVGGFEHTYEVDVVVGETPATFMTKLAALVAADGNKPFTAATSGTPVTTMTFTAVNAGQCCNSWPLIVKGTVAGLTFTLTGWTGGATNPTLTSVFDDVANIRYQTVLWPTCYTLSTLKTFLDARKNVDNNIMEGRAFVYLSDTLANLKSAVAAAASSEIVYLANEAMTDADWKGPHLPEAPDVIAAEFAAVRALRFEDGVSISHVVANNEPDDQFGGIHTASLPYFNTPLLNVGLPKRGSGFTLAEQLELEDAGVTVVGANRDYSRTIMGVVVTGWLTDVAGNPDDTWKFLEWRDSHGVIREYMVNNCRKQFAQHRLTTGVAVPNLAMVDESMIRSFLLMLYDQLTNYGITVRGRTARKLFEDKLVVRIIPENRRVTVAADVPMVSQLGEILGTVKFNFATA